MMIKTIKNILRPIKIRLQQLRTYHRLMKKVRDISINSPVDQENNELTNRPIIMSGIGMEKIGMFAAMQAYIRWMGFAEKKGYTPVVDMKYVPNLYLEDEEIGKVNAWEYYFEKTSDLSLEEAYACKNRLIVNRLDIPPFFGKKDREVFKSIYTSPEKFYEGEERDYWQDIRKKYVNLNKDTEAFIDSQWNSSVGEGEKVLGVMLRGSDYVALRPSGHKVQPTFEQTKEEIDRFLEKYNCDKIFVATEDKAYLERFKELYGNKLFFIDTERVSLKHGELVADAFNRMKVDKKANGLQYVASIAMLSKCDYLISSKTSATEFIFLMKDGDFRDKHIFELGEYV